MRAERVEVVGMEPEPPARVHEGARDPGRLEAEQAVSDAEGVLNLRSIEHAES